MALLELKGFGVSHGATQVAGVDLVVEPASMVAVIGRGDGAVSLLALALAGLLPKGATTQGSSSFTGKRVLYVDRDADASAVVAGPELIVADEPGRGRDPATQFALLQALQLASQTAAVIVFSADFRLALSMGLEVAVVAGGELLLKAPASQIAELPQYDTVRHLVGGARLRTRTLMRPPIGEPMLELDGVTKAYRRGLLRLGPPPVVALSGIGFAVRQGEVVGILGPPGAGKSTLLRLIAGLETPSAGHIGRREGLVGCVFSDPRQAFNPTLPVGVSLTEPLRVEQTLLVEEQADRLVEVVRAVGLEPELLARLPGELGVAELQRMALARALAGRPNLLLLDDPTAYLDPAELREFLVLLARVRADFGLTAIVTSREFEVLRAVADRLLVLEGGHFVEGGKPAELAEAPKQELTRRLVSVRYPGRFVAPVVVEPVAEVVPVASPSDPPSTAPDAGPVAVDAPSTAFGGPFEHSSQGLLASNSSTGAIRPAGQLEAPPPLRGGGPTQPSVAEQGSTTGGPDIDAEAAPEAPVHGLSATVVIAPVVLPEPVAVIVAEAVAPTAAAEPVAPRADLPTPLPEPVTAREVEPAVEAPQPQQSMVPVPDAVAEMVAVEPTVSPITPSEPGLAPAEPILAPQAEPTPASTTEPVVEAARALVADTVTVMASETVVVEVSAEPVMGPIEAVPAQEAVAEAEPASAPVSEATVEVAVLLVTETVVVMAVETVTFEVSVEPVIASAEPAPDEVATVAEPVPAPAPDAPPPEVQAAEPGLASGDGADEAGEGREREGAVQGLVDAAGSADAPGRDAGR